MHTGFSKLTSAMAWERHPTPHSFVWSLGGVFSPPLCSAKKQSGLEKKMPGMFVKLMSISRAGEKKAQRQWGVTLVRIMSLHVTQTGTRPSVNTFPFYALMWVQPFFFSPFPELNFHIIASRLLCKRACILLFNYSIIVVQFFKTPDVLVGFPVLLTSQMQIHQLPPSAVYWHNLELP